MKMKLLAGLYPKWFLLLAFTLLFISYSYAQTNHAPVVSSIHVQQRPGTRLIDITYDLEDADGDLLEITVKVSTDSGKTYNIIPKTLTGDVGKNIKPGKGKKIIWDAKKDMPTAKGSGFKIRITANDGVKPKEIIGKDGAPMVPIPAGDFEMGTDQSEISGLVGWAKKWYPSVEASWFEHEVPRHTVYTDAFYMDVYEVTNAHYRKFMDATGHTAPAYWNDPNYNASNNPVVEVTWDDAKAYADWAGERLPTEAEWEKAARGGLLGKRFPWGDADPNGTQCNFADKNTNLSWSDKSVDDGYQYTALVGKYTSNGYGLYDMVGNVWEWCADWYDSNYYANSPRSNPTGPSSGSYHVCRGGSWYYSTYYLRVAYRSSLVDFGYFSLGFRCVRSVSE